MDTLVVDIQGMPVEFVPWQEAVVKEVNRKVTVISRDPNRIIHSQHFEVGMPRVVQMRNAKALRFRRSVPLTRKNLLIMGLSTSW